MSENKNAKTPVDGPVAFCNGMPAYEGSLSKAQRLTQDLEAPLTINGVPLYPKKEWVGLTDEEINSVCYKRDWTAPWTDTTFARAIEEKLKEKNGGEYRNGATTERTKLNQENT